MNGEPKPLPVHNLGVWGLTAANAVLLGLLGVYTAVAYTRLPVQRPSHFSIAGEPAAWVASDPGPLLLLPAFALLQGVLLVTMALLLPRLQLYKYGLPERQRFLALPWPQQVPLVRSVVLWILVLALVNTSVIGALELTTFGLAGDEPRTPAMLLIGLLPLPEVLVALAGLFVLRRQLERALRCG